MARQNTHTHIHPRPHSQPTAYPPEHDVSGVPSPPRPPLPTRQPTCQSTTCPPPPPPPAYLPEHSVSGVTPPPPHPSPTAYLPEHGAPGVVLQQPAVSGDGGEEGLAGALPDGGARVDAQVAQPPEEPQPQRVKGRQLAPLVLVPLLPVQVLLDALPVLEEVVRDVPLQTHGQWVG